jgi:hypothetical protein
MTNEDDPLVKVLFWIWENGGKITADITAAIGATVGGILQWLYDIWFAGGEGFWTVINLGLGVVADILSWLWEAFLIVKDILFNAIANPLTGIMKWLYDGIAIMKVVLSGGVPSGSAKQWYDNDVGWASGGHVDETGYAKVHKGEDIIPAGKGGLVVNITGQFKSDEEMYRKFVDRLRQEQWRYAV